MPTPSARPFYLEGSLQHYAWGGYNFLPNFLGTGNKNRLPTAEIWYGAHPKSPATLKGSDRDLQQAIEQDPIRLLNPQVANRYANRLPFLLKVLDVREMLSIQVHPTKRAAEEGFADEEANGPERDAPNRNYHDDNHKPELGVALTDFYLLHGFKSAVEIEDSLMDFMQWQKTLLPVLNERGIRGLYRYVMSADQQTIDQLLQPVVDMLDAQSDFPLNDIQHWLQQAVKRYSKDGHHDRGIFSLYWFNLVHLRPGEGIFQGAGIPHAYLYGTCIEVMANSDNVLRGGLTPKHIDVGELLKHIDCSPVNPTILYPQIDGNDISWDTYATPAPEFELMVISRKSGDTIYVYDSEGPSILLLTEGRISSHRFQIDLDQRQRALFIPAGVQVEFDVNADAKAYRVAVGKLGLHELAAGLGHHVSDV
jgi:mannose-6-phosphate isomerase